MQTTVNIGGIREVMELKEESIVPFEAGMVAIGMGRGKEGEDIHLGLLAYAAELPVEDWPRGTESQYLIEDACGRQSIVRLFSKWPGATLVIRGGKITAAHAGLASFIGKKTSWFEYCGDVFVVIWADDADTMLINPYGEHVRRQAHILWQMFQD